jgi:hypothetical protein
LFAVGLSITLVNRPSPSVKLDRHFPAGSFTTV